MNDQIASKEHLNCDTYTLRLSRMNNELVAMLSELHSYRYEPYTPDMHKKYKIS